MLNRERYKRAIGALHASEHISWEVNEMPNNDYSKRSFKRIPRAAAAAIAIFVLLGGTVAYAAVTKWSFADFFRNGEVPETAKTVVITDQESGNITIRSEDEFGNDILENIMVGYENVVTFSLSFTVCDGKTIYVGFEATVPEGSGYFLLPPDLDGDDDLYMTSLKEGTDYTQAMSINDYCAEKGLQMIRIDGSFPHEDDEVELLSARGEQIAPDKVEILLTGHCKTNVSELNLEVIYRAFLFAPETKQFALIADKTQELGVPVEMEGESVIYELADGESGIVGDTGISVKQVRLTTTTLSTYSEIMVKNEDETAGNHVSVHLVDDDGTYFNPGPSHDGSNGTPGADGWFSCTQDLRRFESIPDVVHVKVINLYTEDVGTIDLIRAN